MLNQRLQACAAWITDGKTVCDVGTDHAYLAAELLRKERCQHVIASDIGEGPLQAARRTLEQAGLLQRATLLLSDGLEQVDGTDVSHVVIAGMGGETIVHILENCPWRRQVHLILQPMTKIPDLRLWLAQQGFGWSEQVVQEGEKFYVILSARYTGTVRTLSPLEQEIGCVDWQSESVRRYAGWKQQRFQKLAQQLEQAGRAEAADWAALAQAIQEKL